MAYNKRQKLQDNIEAIRIALVVEKENRNATADELVALRKFSGFGGLKFVLNPIDDVSTWKKGDIPFFADTIKLHELLKQYSKDDNEYQSYVSSIKRSVNTAFYTPNAIIRAISKALSYCGISVNKFLDPSSGNGKFIDVFKADQSGMDVTAFEKDLLTGKVLKAVHPEDKVIIDGFETISKNELGTFDLTTSNIPFGDVKVFDPEYTHGNDEHKKIAANTLHNYFFIKALDTVHDGGIVAFITSRGVLDSPRNAFARYKMSEMGTVVSAVRLPDGMFSNEAGTEAGSDLIILQKRDSKISVIPSDIDNIVRESKKTVDEITVNGVFDQYNIDAPGHVLSDEIKVGKNMYGELAYEYPFDGDIEKLSQKLQELLSADFAERLDVNLYNKNIFNVQEQNNPVKENQKSKEKVVSGPVQLDLFAIWDEQQEQENKFEPRDYSGKVKSHWRDGVVVADGEQLGILSNIQSGGVTFTPFKDSQLKEREYPLMRQYILVRDLYNELYNIEAEEKVAHDDLRQRLNEAYDTFVNRFGALNDKKNQRILLYDVLSRDMLCVENSVDDKFVKSDIFNHPVSFVSNEIEHVDTPEEALFVSLNRNGEVDLDYMEDLTGTSKAELITLLKGKIYYMPNGNYEIAPKVLSGNIYDKIDGLTSYIERLSADDSGNKEVIDKLEETKAALVAVRPKEIAFDEIGLQFGERWIPTSYYEDYISKLFGTKMTINYAERIDEYSCTAESRYNVKIREEFCVHGEYKDYDGIALLQHAFHNTSPDIMKCVGYNEKGQDVKAPDMDKIRLANNKIQEIQDGFTAFLTNLPQESRDELQSMYNRKFNCYVKAKYDGSHQTFPGIDLKALASPRFNIQNIYKSQKDCVWMILQNGGGVCDHEVGTGKSLIMCMAAHEMHRLGIANKPLIIAMKANVNEIAATYQAAFPNDKMLYASEKDFSPASRVQFFNRIKNNDYSCVIMSHEQFCKIPQPMEIQERIMQDELYDIEEALDVLRQQGEKISGRMLSGLETRKDNLVAKIKNLQYIMNQRTDDVVDFGTMGIDHIFIDESHQFKNLMFTTRHQRVSGLGNPAGSQKATNLLYAIRTIQDRTGKDLGATFLSGTTISNSLTELYLLFKYLRPQAMAQQGIHSFDAWSAVYAKKVRDYEFNVTNQVALKERFRYFVKVPELATFYEEVTDYRTGEDVGLDRPNMNIILHNIKPTKDQQEFNKRLVEFAKTGNGELIYRGPLSDSEEKSKMLIATTASRKASLDMRLLDPSFGDDPDNKASHCARLVSEYYKKYDEQKGTQFIFSDLSTYKPGEWNIYSEIKRKLVEDYNIPAEEIRFIQEAKNEKQRKQIINDMNDGKIRVLFGSTSTLGTGVNAQKRAVAVHHIDIPWRPSDLEQRNGRARRTGNWVAKEFAGNNVDIIIYAVERSLDVYKFNLLQNKQFFVSQLKSNKLGSRVIDEGALDEENGMSFAEMVAILSDNDDLLKKAKLEKEIMGLESERKSYMQARRETESRLNNARSTLESNNVIIKNMTEDRDKFKSLVKYEKEGNTTLPGLVLNNVEEYAPDGTYNIDGMGQVLQDAGRSMGNKSRQLGTVYGFPLVVDSMYQWDSNLKQEIFAGNHFYVQGHYKYEYNNGKIALSKDNRIAAVRYGVNALEKVSSYITQYETRNKTLLENIAEYERIAGKEWQGEQKLQELKHEMEALEKKIQDSLDETVSSLPKPEEPVYKIFKEGREHKVTFSRDVLNLVSFEEMRKAADSKGNWRNHGYVSGSHWVGNHMVSDEEISADFSLRQTAEEWIKKIMDLQKSRIDNKDWLTDKANEDTDGYMVNQSNEVIFSARKQLAKINGEEYEPSLPADVRQLLFEQANLENYHLIRYGSGKPEADEARKTLNDYGIDWHTNLAMSAVKDYLEKWEQSNSLDISEKLEESVNRLNDLDQSLLTEEEKGFLDVVTSATNKRYMNGLDGLEAKKRLGVYTDYLCNVLKHRKDVQESVTKQADNEENQVEETENVSVKQVDVMGLMGVLSTKGEAKLSDFAKPVDVEDNSLSIINQIDLDTDEVYIVNHSEAERKSLRYVNGEYYENYLQRNNLTGNEDDAKLYFHDKYTSAQWNDINELFAKMTDKESAIITGRKVAELSFVGSFKEGQGLFNLLRKINTEIVLPYLDGLNEGMKERKEASLLKQFYDLKAKHPEALLLFRTGDFYTIYEKDAETASKVLGITLTWRKNSSADYKTFKGALATFPHHALDTYLPKLIRSGFRVAICDQLEAPVKKPVKRITELVTPSVKMQVVDHVSSLYPIEKTIISQIVQDLANSDLHEIPASSHSNAYWSLLDEYKDAINTVNEGLMLTNRQRDILIEASSHYRGGVSDLTASIHISEEQLRKALISNAAKEQRAEENFNLYSKGSFWYLNTRAGFGLNTEYANKLAEYYSAEIVENRDKKLLRFTCEDDARNFVSNITLLNERYTNVLRDGLIEKMRKAGIDVNTDWQEGERVLAQENGRVSMMGSTTRKRQQEIGEYLNDFDLNENEKKIVEAFGGNTDGDIVTLKDSKGKDRHIVFIQGNDNGVGIKHSVFTHYGTRRGVYVAEDILKIPQVIEFGERKQNGNRISYSAYISDKKFTLITEKTSEGKEEFINYFSNKKIEKQRDFKAPQALSGDTELTARAANVLNSVAKVQNNSEITKENTENLHKKSVFGYSQEEIEAQIGPRLTMNNYNDIRRINPFIGFLWSNKIPETLDYREVFKTPTLDDYFVATKAEFKNIGLSLGLSLDYDSIVDNLPSEPWVKDLAEKKELTHEDVDKIVDDFILRYWSYNSKEDITSEDIASVLAVANPKKQLDMLQTAQKGNMLVFEKMKESGKYEYTHSPSSDSQYLIDRETGDIFRLSNHWGRVASCMWDIDQKHSVRDHFGEYYSIFQLGKCNISDFRGISGLRRAFNPEYNVPYADALARTIANYDTLLHSNVDITDAARKKIESALENYNKLQKLFQEKGYVESRYSVKLHKFDNQDIRYMLVPDSQSPIFISNAWLALQKVKQDKATPEQWLKMMEKLGGIKTGEDRWTGLSQWLKDSQEKSLSKMDIAKYLHDNMINVEEVHYIEARSLEDSEQFRAYQREFDDIKAHVDDLYEAADNKYGEFIDEMKEKYGEDWMDQLTDDEDRQERYLLKVREDYDSSYHTRADIAYGEMISRYGDDWGMAFAYYDDNGELTIADEDRAVYFLGDEVSVDRTINDIRLQNTTKALTNKREIALTIPTIKSYIIGGRNGDIHFDDADDGRAVAWVRFGETKDGKGNRVLVIDEIQSKRHQEGREKGYRLADTEKKLREIATRFHDIRLAIENKYGIHRSLLDFDELNPDLNVTEEERKEYNDIARKYKEIGELAHNDALGKTVPDAPFEKNWHELAMKRMLRYAAENGYDRVAWLNGQQQAERYDLSKNINFISYNKETQKLLAGTLVDGVIDYDKYNIEETVEPDELSKFIGKDLAPKVLDKGILQGDDLRVGGDGMKAFYDEMLPNFMNKYCKQWGVHVEDMDIPALQREDSSDGVALHGVKVTEQMKQDVLQGQPMFFRSGEHQAYGFVHNGTIYLDPRIATAETPIHEYTHLWAEVLRQRNPQEWQNIVQMMKDTPEVWNYVKQNYSHLKTDNQIADEALAQFSGKHGYKKLQEFVDGKQNADSIFEKIKEVLDKFWSHVADFFGVHYNSKEEVADRILYDLLNEVNPLDYRVTAPVVNIDNPAVLDENPFTRVAADRVFFENFLREQQEKQINSENFKQWFGDWEKPSIYRAYMVDDVAGLKDRYPSVLPQKFYEHSTVSYGLQNKDDREGQQKHMHIIGRLTTDKLDVLVVDNPESDNKYAHITLATAVGVKPVESNAELEKHTADIVPLDDYVDVTFKNVLNRNLSKVVDADGKPLSVEHGTHADFTVFDISKIGENSKDNGLFGAGFYFGTKAPGWLNDGNEDYRTMKVFLDIKHPFEVNDTVISDIYSEIVEKMDTPAMRGLTIKGFNDHEIQVGALIGHIKAVDELIKNNPDEVNKLISEDKELQYYHSDDRERLWHSREIVRRSGIGSIAMSWQVLISDQIGSHQFTAAAIQDGYDGVIVDRGEGYKEYVVFEPTQAKSATNNIGLFSKENPDIRYHLQEQAVSPETFKSGDIIITLPDSTGARKIGRVDKIEDNLLHYTVSNGYIMVGQSAPLEIATDWRLATDEEKTAFLNEEKRVLATESGQEQQRRQVQPIVPRRLTVEDREAGGAMVDHLESMGITVHTDLRENRRVLKAAEKDNSEVGKIRHMKTETGESYGFAYKGELHLDLRKIDAELPLHEYSHLWCESLRRINPDNWSSVVDTIKNDSEAMSFVRERYPELTSIDDQVEEVIANYSGKRGAEKLQAELQRMTPRDDNYISRWNNIFHNISKAIQDFWKHVGDSLNIKYKNKEDIADMILKDFATGVNPVAKVQKWMDSREKEYEQAVQTAVNSGNKEDWKPAERIFSAALKEQIGNGITPFMAIDGYRGKLDQLAHAVKEQDNDEAISEAAKLMAVHVPSNAVLVPAPSHLGYATDTLKLANSIADIANVPVCDVLKSEPRDSQYDVKKLTGQPIPSEELGIYKAGELPEDKIPFVIDNVVQTGNTAEACIKALGTGVVYSLSSAVTPGTHVSSLTSAQVAVFDKEGVLIPLSKRFEIQSKWKGRASDYIFGEKPEKPVKIAGLENYSEEDIKKFVKEHFNSMLEGSDIDAKIVDIKVIGSRVNGNNGKNSDLDVLLEFDGNVSEDGLFNILNNKEDRLFLEGIPVDINPITKYKSGTIQEFMERNADYEKDMSNKNISSMENKVSEKELQVGTIDQLQEKAVGIFGKNFTFNFWNETDAGTKVDRPDLGGMPDTISVDRLEIKDGKLSLYSDDIASDIDLQSMDAVDIAKVDASLGDIKAYLDAHQKTDVLEHLFNNSVNHETEERPYHIVIGTDDRPGGVKGEFHVDFGDSINAISFPEMQQLAKEHGGEMRLTNGHLWADFDSEPVAKTFADLIVDLNVNSVEKEYKRLEDSHRLRDIGYPFARPFGPEKPWNVAPTDVNLYWNYAAGNITLNEAAQKFKEAGFTDSVNVDYVREAFAKLNLEFKKLDVNLQLRPMSEISIEGKPAIEYTIKLQGNQTFEGYQVKFGDMALPKIENAEMTAAAEHSGALLSNSEDRIYLFAKYSEAETFGNKMIEVNKKLSEQKNLAPLTDEEMQKMKNIGYPYAPGNDKANENAPIPEMIYWRLSAGIMDINDAVRSFNTCGYTNGENPERTKEILTQLNEKYGKLDKELKPAYKYADILNRDEKFRYMMLSRLQSDVNYFLGNGNRHEPNLWTHNKEEHIELMYKLWDSLPEKPEWLTREQLDEYAKQMRQPSEVEQINVLKNELKGILVGAGLEYSPLAPQLEITLNSVYNSDENRVLRYATFEDDRLHLYENKEDAYSGRNYEIQDVLEPSTQLKLLTALTEYYRNENNNVTKFIDTQNVPSYALSAIINGDFSGIDSEDDEKEVRNFMDNEQYKGAVFVPRDEHPSFTTATAFGLPTDCVTVDILRTGTIKQFRDEQVDPAITPEVVQDNNDAAIDEKKSTGVNEISSINVTILNIPEQRISVDIRGNEGSFVELDIRDGIITSGALTPSEGEKFVLDNVKGHSLDELIGKSLSDKILSMDMAETIENPPLEKGAVIFNILNYKSQAVMGNNQENVAQMPVAEEQQVTETQQQEKPVAAKKGWNIDYSKYKIPEGITIEKSQVWKNDKDEWNISATIDGQRKTRTMYNNDVSAFFEKDAEGNLTHKVSKDQLVAKYFFGEKKESQAEAQAQTPSENVKIERPSIYKLTQGKNAGLYAISALVDNARKTRVLTKDEVTNYFKKDNEGKRNVLNELASKYFGKSADNMSIGSVGEAEKVKAEQQQAKEADAKEDIDKAQAELKQKEEQRKAEEAKKEEKKTVPVAVVQAQLITGALLAAGASGGVFLNKDGKKSPDFAMREHMIVSPFNQMMMALHSDANGYKTNQYVTFGDASKEGFSVKKGETGLAYNWYAYDKYVNRFDSNDIISKEDYEALDEDKKGVYKQLRSKEEKSIFNVDQTTMSSSKKEDYSKLLAAEEKSVVGRGMKENIESQEKGLSAMESIKKAVQGDALLLLRTENKTYEIHGDDAIKAGKILGLEVTDHPEMKDAEGNAVKVVNFPVKELENVLPKIIRSGERVAIADKPESEAVIKRYGTADSIYKDLSELTEKLKAADSNIVVSSIGETAFDKETGVLHINDSRSSAPGEEVSTAISRANDLYRAVALYTGTAERLNRGGKMLPEDAVKYDRLVAELSAGVMMSHKGLPATLSASSMQMVPYFERELKEDPKLVGKLENDVNNAVKVIGMMRKGEGIDYATIRGEKSIESMRPKFYTIATALNSYPDMEAKRVVIIKDAKEKSAAVILPAGASLEVKNEVPGMSKERIAIALRKEGIDGDKITFYNAGGSLGLNQPNDFYKDKDVTVGHLKQYDIVIDETLDLKEEISRTSMVDLDMVRLIKDDNDRYAIYVKPTEGKPVTVYPEPNDIKLFFASIKNGEFDKVREAIGQKYYAFVQKYPEMEAGILAPEIPENIDMSRITKVNITKDKKYDNQFVMFAEIDGHLEHTKLSQPQGERLFLVDDQTLYKQHLAAVLFGEKLGIAEGLEAAQFRDADQGQVNDNTEETSQEEDLEQENHNSRGIGR